MAAAIGLSGAVMGALGAAVVILEGLQQLFQWNTTWMLYRSTAEALKRERYLYLAHGPYGNTSPGPLLAERVEAILAQENATWRETTGVKAKLAEPGVPLRQSSSAPRR